MRHRWMRPALGVLAAIAITTVMDATGYSVFSALPLMALLALFWRLERLTRVEAGFVWGRAGHDGLALLHPALVLGLAALVAGLAAPCTSPGPIGRRPASTWRR